MTYKPSMRYLPEVTPIEFHILLSLLISEQHGLSLIQEISERTKQEIFLSPGTLYSALKRMYKDGWIEQSEEAPPAKDGNAERRRYYRLSESGYEVLVDEVERMERVARETRPLLERAQNTGYPLTTNLPRSDRGDHSERDRGASGLLANIINVTPLRRKKRAASSG